MANSSEDMVGAGLTGVFLASCVYLVLAALSWEKALDTKIQAASAIGTVAAVLVTLWLTHRQDKQRRKLELNRASLVAAGLVPRLSSLRQAIHEITAATRQEIGPEPPDPQDHNRFIAQHCATYRSLFASVTRMASLTILNIGVNELVDLTPLPEACASRLYLEICRVNDSIVVAQLALEAPDIYLYEQALHFGRNGQAMLGTLESCVGELNTIFDIIMAWRHANQCEGGVLRA